MLPLPGITSAPGLFPIAVGGGSGTAEFDFPCELFRSFFPAAGEGGELERLESFAFPTRFVLLLSATTAVSPTARPDTGLDLDLFNEVDSLVVEDTLLGLVAMALSCPFDSSVELVCEESPPRR